MPELTVILIKFKLIMGLSPRACPDETILVTSVSIWFRYGPMRNMCFDEYFVLHSKNLRKIIWFHK